MTWLRRFEPLLRPPIQTWFAVTRRMTLGVRVLVVNPAGEVLLVQPAYRHGWELPGGGVERGERPGESAARELLEEAGVRALEEPRLLSAHSHHAFFRGDYVLLYRVDRWEATDRKPDWEIAAVGWFPLAALPPDATPGTARRAAEILRGEAPHPDW